MIYAIDVDGVIVDSRTHAIIDTFNTYRELFRDTKICGGEKITLNNYREILDKNESTQDSFHKLASYARDAEEMVFIFYLIDKNIEVDNDDEFRAKFNEMEHTTLKKWHEEFYRQREFFQQQEGWEKTIEPYSEMVDFIKKNIGKTVIISNKDLKTITKILLPLGIDIPAEKIFSKELTTDKNEKINVIVKKFNVNYQDILFIEDNFSNARDAKALGVNIYLAVWGLNNKEQRRNAKRLGIKLLALADLKKF